MYLCVQITMSNVLERHQKCLRATALDEKVDCKEISKISPHKKQFVIDP